MAGELGLALRNVSGRISRPGQLLGRAPFNFLDHAGMRAQIPWAWQVSWKELQSHNHFRSNRRPPFWLKPSENHGRKIERDRPGRRRNNGRIGRVDVRHRPDLFRFRAARRRRRRRRSMDDRLGVRAWVADIDDERLVPMSRISMS